MGIVPRLGIDQTSGSGFLGSLGSVLGAALAAFFHADGVEGSADYVIANSGKVFDPATSNHNDRVLLEIMSDTRNIGGHLDSIGQPNSGDLAQCRVRFLGCLGIDPDANAPTLWAAVESWTFGSAFRRLARAPNKLINRRQDGYSGWFVDTNFVSLSKRNNSGQERTSRADRNQAGGFESPPVAAAAA